MFWAVIMAGGAGTRFWPESRAHLPKQFLNIFGKKTLLEQTLHRLSPVIPASRVLVVTQQSKIGHVCKLLKIPASQVIGEPIGRNTAPCAVLAAQTIFKKDPNAVIALLPSDHRIGKPALFRKLLQAASDLCGQYAMPVTFGIKPAFPHTGYGYLELGKRKGVRRGIPVYRLKRFREKPSLQKAKQFVRSGKYLWNSGMFVWKASDLIAAAKKYQPKMIQVGDKILASKKIRKYFHQMPSISIDYGLMEHLKGRILALPADMDWNDLGGWRSFEDLWPSDKKGNIVSGPSLFVDSSKNIVKSDGRLVTLLGVKDLVVVSTKDALLVCHKDKTESIREIVAALKEKRLIAYL